MTKDRPGWNADVDNINDTMAAIGNKKLLPLKLNPSRDEIFGWIDEILDELQIRDGLCDKKKPLFLFLMGHGSEKGIIDPDRQTFHEEHLISALNTPSMNERLKVVVMVSCRGSRQPPSMICDDGPTSQRPIQNLIIMFSSQKGFVSKRRSEEGVPFIEELCSELRRKYKRWSILKLFDFVKLRLTHFKINKTTYNLTPDIKLYNVSVKYQKIAIAFL